MPLSNELVVGFPLANGAKMLSADAGVKLAAGVDLGTPDLRYDRLSDTLAPLIEVMAPDLKAIHRRLLEDRFGPVRDADWGNLTADTPAGERTFIPFSLNFYADPDEAGDSPQDYVIGVALASRYWPVWIDWREPHGTSGTFRLNSEMTEMVEEASGALMNRWGCFALAELIVKPVFY